ncbi:MAG: hypothetical protein AB1631_28550 [Acidobacteriota bacterium]
MPAVYPVMPVVGYTFGDEFSSVLRRYADGTYRRWMNSTFNWQFRVLLHEDIKQADKDAVKSFFVARWSSSGDFEFYWYDPEVVSTIDLTGASLTGRHTAIFEEPRLEFTRSGRCRWSTEIPIRLLN